MQLTLEKVYIDKILGKMMYIGRIGYELNMSGVKGKAVFVNNNRLVTLTKKEINQLTN